MEDSKTNNRYNWLIWLVILIIALLLALWAKSCRVSPVAENNYQWPCSNAYYNTMHQDGLIVLNEESVANLWKNINQTGNLSSLNGLDCLELLEAVWGQDQSLNDITDIVYIKNLKRLYLYNTAITDISPLSQLDNLERLILNNINISNITPLQTSITNLEYLNLSYTNVSDISLLTKARKLETLYLGSTAIKDLSPLYDLANLKYLNLYDTAFSRSWYGTEINNDLDNQLRVLQTKHSGLEIIFTQFSVVDSENTPFEGWRYQLNFLDWDQFL